MLHSFFYSAKLKPNISQLHSAHCCKDAMSVAMGFSRKDFPFTLHSTLKNTPLSQALLESLS